MGDSFTVLGGGQGFGFDSCVPKFDVSGYDYWTTFSGVSKTNPAATPALIHESRVLAMKLYWLGKKANVTCKYKFTDDPEKSRTATELGYDEYDISGSEVSADNSWEPTDRVCGLPRNWDCEPNPDPFFPDDCYSWAPVQIYTGEGSDIYLRLFPVFRPYNGVLAMYNGDKNNEDNFVGFGGSQAKEWDMTAGGGFVSSYSSPFITRCYCAAQYAGCGNDLPPLQQETKTQSVGYTTLNGLNVVGFAMNINFSQYNDDGDLTHQSTGTANGAGGTATAKYKRRSRIPDTDPPEYEMKLICTANAGVSSIEYYTI